MGVVKEFPNRFEIHLVSLDPTVGSEIKKTRPCVVISPDSLHHYMRTVTIAPMTTKSHPHKVRVPVVFQNKSGLILLDQIRTVDKSRLVKRLGKLNHKEAENIASILVEMFVM